MKELLNLSENSSLQELEKIVARLITNTGDYHRSFWTNLIVPQLFRARIHNNLVGNIRDNGLNPFTSEVDFWNRPKDFIKEFGRCNDIEQSLLYCSNSWETAIAEVRPVEDDYLSMSVFRIKQDGLGSRISPVGIQYLSQIESLKNTQMLDNYKISDKIEIKEMDNFLDDLFHLEVKNDEKYKYKLSIAVTNCLMKNIQMGEALHAMHGIMYSSIVRNKKNYNLVLRPTHARTIYKLHQIQTFKVIKSENGKILLELKRNGYTVGTKHHPLDFFEILWEEVAESPNNFVEILV